MKNVYAFIIVLCILVSLISCGEIPEDPTGNSGGNVSTDFAQESDDMFTDNDKNSDYTDEGSVTIDLNGDTATSSSNSVKISGSTVTITEEATYIISGTLTDGMIVVNAPEIAKPHIILNGVSVTSQSSAALYVLECDKLFVTLAEGSENTLSNGGEFVAIDDNNIDGAVFSKQDLTFNGKGTLTVASPVGHGVVCKDDLVITDGVYKIKTSSHGLDVNDSIRLANVNITLQCGKDGMHSENDDDTTLGFVYIESGEYSITAEGDGISAGSYIQIEGGSFNILTGGGSENSNKTTSDSWGGFPGGMGGRPRASTYTASSSDDSTSIKGIKAAGSLLINGGSFTIDSADDAVHSNTSVIINYGTFDIESGDDGFHADETILINGSTVNIKESYEGLEGLHVEITGGDIALVASDDGINAAGGNDSSGFGGNRGDMFGGMGGGMSSSSNGTIIISDGKIYINASGDGIDANGTFTMSGGEVTVCGPTSGDTSVLDYDKSATITGGTFIGTGAYQMAQTFSASEQGVIAVSTASQSAGTSITLADRDGNVLITYEPKLSFQIIILSCPEMKSGETYKITVGEQSAEFEAA